MASRRWTLYVCDDCGGSVDKFAPNHVHPDVPLTSSGQTVVEVMPVSDALAALEEVASQLDRKASASAIVDGPFQTAQVYREAASLIRTHLDRLRGES